MKFGILFLFYLYFSSSVFAEDMRYVQDSLQRELTVTVNREKRYMLLRHLADLSTATHTDGFYFFRQLYDEAHSAGDESVAIEALLELGNHPSLDSLCSYTGLAEQLPSNAASKGLLVFLKSKVESCRIRNFSDEERVNYLTKLLEKYKKEEKTERDIYDHILSLHILCTHLGYSIGGDLYAKYLEEEEKLLTYLPPENYYLKSNLLVRLAILYANRGESVKAVETDKKLLQYISEREKVYKQQGRKYRNYYTFNFAIYRRMLSNYQVLTWAEVDSCFDRLKQLCEVCPEAKEDFYAASSRSHLYYYIATEQYARARPYIDTLLARPHYVEVPRHLLLKYKISVSRALGQEKEELEAMRVYITAVDEYVEGRAREKFKEMQVLYEVERLNEKTKEVEHKSEHQAKLYVTYIAVILGLLLVVLLLYNLHARRLMSRLKCSELALQEDKKSLMSIQQELVQARDEAEASSRVKTLFMHNMSHEIRTPLNAIVGFSQLLAADCEKAEMKEYADLVFTNGELLLTIVNDLLQLSDMESGKLKLTITSCSLNALCNLVLGSVSHRLGPEVKLKFSSNRPEDFHLNTDAVRLQQVLLNFLTNAIKFTQEGRIELSYLVDEEQKKVIFAVTDTGPGIPADQSERIFERFEKLDTFSQGNGLGLHICKLIASLLQGEVRLDTDYTKGARFLFIHPIR